MLTYGQYAALSKTPCALADGRMLALKHLARYGQAIG